MTRVRIYAASSIDGFIADSEGDTEWLEAFKDSVFQASGFLDEIGAVVLGRRTLELLRAFGDWPYEGKRCFVLASEAMWNLPEGCVFVRSGIAAAVQAARESTSKDVWVAGGATTMQSAIEADLVDTIEICIAPVMVGSGINLLNGLSQRLPLHFDGITTFPQDIIKLRYLRDPE